MEQNNWLETKICNREPKVLLVSGKFSNLLHRNPNQTPYPSAIDFFFNSSVYNIVFDEQDCFSILNGILAKA